jgi:hypothetical protein
MYVLILTKNVLDTFGATFSQTHLVALLKSFDERGSETE